MSHDLHQMRVAVLVANGFEQSEMTEPVKALQDAGAKLTLVSPVEGKVRGWKDKNWGDEFSVDVHIKDARPDDYDALLLPGGVMNPDTLRMCPASVNFVSTMFNEG
jgi:protease I